VRIIAVFLLGIFQKRDLNRRGKERRIRGGVGGKGGGPPTRPPSAQDLPSAVVRRGLQRTGRVMGRRTQRCRMDTGGGERRGEEKTPTSF